jgi:hypothetical protein
MLIQHGEVQYKTDSGEVLAVFKSHSYRTVRGEKGEGGLAYEPQLEYRYSEAELEAIERDIRAEEVRGANPRYWEDVKVGDELVPVVKGPLDRITMTIYYAGALATSGYKACEAKWKQWFTAKSTPNYCPTTTTEPIFPSASCPAWVIRTAPSPRPSGCRAAYDNGHQRIGWMSHVVTNWMGDTGFMAELHTRIRRPNLFGNTTWVRGRVTEKLEYESKPAVRLDLWADDQGGTRNTTGTAIVVLPTRK